MKEIYALVAIQALAKGSGLITVEGGYENIEERHCYNCVHE